MDVLRWGPMDGPFHLSEPGKERLRAILARGAQTRAVDEGVDLRQRAMRVRICRDRATAAVMVMVVAVTGILAPDLELRRADARTVHALGPDRVPIDRQAAEGPANLLERHARVDERADDHVAGGTREAVEV